jgi:hypothetical protein
MWIEVPNREELMAKRRIFEIDQHDLMVAYVEFIAAHEHPYWTDYQEKEGGPVQQGFHEKCKALFEHQPTEDGFHKNLVNEGLELGLSSLKSRITRLLKKMALAVPVKVQDQGDDVSSFILTKKIERKPKPPVVIEPEVDWSAIIKLAKDKGVGAYRTVDAESLQTKK